jgi:glutathione peroxidase
MPSIAPFKHLSLACALALAAPAFAQAPADPTAKPNPAKDTLSVSAADDKPAAKKSDEGGDPEAAPKGNGGGGGMGGGRRGRGGAGGGGGGAASDKVVYDFELPGPDGKGIPLSTYKGKTLLIVNLGRNSSYATQIAGLNKLAEQYKDKGLVVIGIPSNEFGAAEPGTDAEIQKIYHDQDKVAFPVMAKSKLDGDDAMPLFEFLEKAQLSDTGPVHWNFTKFIIDAAAASAATPCSRLRSPPLRVAFVVLTTPLDCHSAARRRNPLLARPRPVQFVREVCTTLGASAN